MRFVAVTSFENGKKTLEYTHGENVIIGEIVDFTKTLSEKNEIIIEANIKPDDLTGKLIVVQNGDDVRGGAYKILSAKQKGKNIALNIGRVTLIRRFKDSMNPEKGYIYNIAHGQSLKIPLTSENIL